MKKTIAAIIAMILVASLSACGSPSPKVPSAQGNHSSQVSADKPKENVKTESNGIAADYLKTITAETAEAKGVCGADLTWYYKDNVLVIKGTGDMTDFGDDVPWAEFYQKIQWVIMDDGITSIGFSAFAAHDNTSYIAKVTIPDGVKTIGESAFRHCISLTSITLPDGLKTIGEAAFRECPRLTSVTLPDGLETIKDDAFYDCTSLTSITLPDGLETIGYHALGSDLKTLTVPASVKEILNFGSATEITFEGDAPDLQTYMEPIVQYGGNVASWETPCIKALLANDLSDITIYYSGAGFDTLIEQCPGYNWVKQ